MEALTRSSQQLLDWPIQNRARLTTVLAVAFGAVPVIILGRRSYSEYKSLGPGGLPYNIVGWIIQGLMRPIARSDTRAPAPYKRDSVKAAYGPNSDTSYLDDGGLSARRPPRPVVPNIPAPQRQITDAAPERLPAMNGFLTEFTHLNASLLVMQPSGLEHPSQQAVFLNVAKGSTPPAHLKSTKGEIAHVHPEGSMHVVLSLTDAENVIEKGWGERHRLSGVGPILPWSFVLVYAPRDEAEFRVWKNIVKAGIECAAASIGEEVVEPPT